MYTDICRFLSFMLSIKLNLRNTRCLCAVENPTCVRVIRIVTVVLVYSVAPQVFDPLFFLFFYYLLALAFFYIVCAVDTRFQRQQWCCVCVIFPREGRMRNVGEPRKLQRRFLSESSRQMRVGKGRKRQRGDPAGQIHNRASVHLREYEKQC